MSSLVKTADKAVSQILKSFAVEDALFMIADTEDSIKPSKFTRYWYNGNEEDIFSDKKKITDNCRQLRLADFVKVENSVWEN